MANSSHTSNLKATLNVRNADNDKRPYVTQNANVAKRSRNPRLDKHAEYRERSGWWLAAWRDYAKLSLEDLADEMKTSKGQVSDLETGNGAARYNRDWVEKAAGALRVPQGYLMDVNPFEADEVLERMLAAYRRLDDDGRHTAADMIDVLAKGQKA